VSLAEKNVSLFDFIAFIPLGVQKIILGITWSFHPNIRILVPVRKVEARSGWLQRKQPHCSLGPLYSNTSKNLHREK
jgi:hypothetical protein